MHPTYLVFLGKGIFLEPCLCSVFHLPHTQHLSALLGHVPYCPGLEACPSLLPPQYPPPQWKQTPEWMIWSNNINIYFHPLSTLGPLIKP